MSLLSAGARALTRVAAETLPIAASRVDDAALAAARSVVGAGASDELVQFSARVNLRHIFAGELVDGSLQGLHHVPAPGRLGDLTIDAISRSKKVLPTPPRSDATWNAMIGAQGVQPKTSVMFPTSWTRTDVLDAVHHIHRSAPRIPSTRPDNPLGYLQEGTFRGIDLRVVGDSMTDTIVTAFPRRPNQIVTP